MWRGSRSAALIATHSCLKFQPKFWPSSPSRATPSRFRCSPSLFQSQEPIAKLAQFPMNPKPSSLRQLLSYLYCQKNMLKALRSHLQGRQCNLWGLPLCHFAFSSIWLAMYCIGTMLQLAASIDVISGTGSIIYVRLIRGSLGEWGCYWAETTSEKVVFSVFPPLCTPVFYFSFLF